MQSQTPKPGSALKLSKRKIEPIGKLLHHSIHLFNSYMVGGVVGGWRPDVIAGLFLRPETLLRCREGALQSTNYRGASDCK